MKSCDSSRLWKTTPDHLRVPLNVYLDVVVFSSQGYLPGPLDLISRYL